MRNLRKFFPRNIPPIQLCKCGNVKEVIENRHSFYKSNFETTAVLQHFQRKECPKIIILRVQKTKNVDE